MNQLTCEMCGGTDLIKQDGVFVCQNCGIKYSVEEAKKMMIEGVVDVSGSTIKIDHKSKIENLLIRARQFESTGETQKAYDYYNRILDMDANNEIAKFKTVELSPVYIGTVKISKSTLQQIEYLLSTNQKIEAIKCVREITELSLADAKAWCDNYQTHNLAETQAVQNNCVTPATNQKSGCYVATCVYSSYDCPQVWTLRRFRDDTLAETWYGRAFIHTYYAISPTLVKWFGHTEWFKKMWKGKLDRMVANLNANGVEDTPYKDKQW